MPDTNSSLYDIFAQAALESPGKIIFQKRQADGSFGGLTNVEMKTNLDRLAVGLIDAGAETGDRCIFFCDSTTNWCWADCAILSSGMVTVPRGTDVTDEDIVYIVNHSGAKQAIVQKESDKERLIKLQAELPDLKDIYVLEDDNGDLAKGAGSVGALIETGAGRLSTEPAVLTDRLAQIKTDELATLIYTSGTTGAPKGVMLSQNNWLVSIKNSLERAQLSADDRTASLLPPWHVFERILEYATVQQGMVYLITDVQNLTKDLGDFKPTFFPSVPRIWEMVYNGITGKLKKAGAIKRGLFNSLLKVGLYWSRNKAIVFGYDPQMLKPNPLLNLLSRLIALVNLVGFLPAKLLALVIFRPIHKALGGKLRISLSSGSALPGIVEEFLSGIGLKVLEGYGMTEVAAGIAIRMPDKPTAGTLGTLMDGVEYKLKDLDGKELAKAPGTKGTLWLKGDQVMLGYYKRDDLNADIFDKDGFMNTGDLMTFNWRGELLFTGRSKDTLVLAGGENVEPLPIEDKLLNSDYIDQVIVVGDDKKNLSVLIVPSFDSVTEAIAGAGEPASWNGNKEIRTLFKKQIQSLVSKDNGFKSFELIPPNNFCILAAEFDKDTEMTRTLKMKRPIIKENYAGQIEGIYK